MHVISCNGGDDSVALIQWAHQQALSDVFVVSIDTGWAAPGWAARVATLQNLVERYQFNWVPLTAKASFQALVTDRHSFPNQKFQWCAGFLKGLPLLAWLDKHDPACNATILLPKRRAASHAGVFLEEFIPESEHHGERRVWHPLVEVNDEGRDLLVREAGFTLLGHRSLECDPCVNSLGTDLVRLEDETINKVAQLEEAVGKPMFAPASTGGADGIRAAIAHARAQTAQGESAQETSFNMGCGSPFGCGL